MNDSEAVLSSPDSVIDMQQALVEARIQVSEMSQRLADEMGYRESLEERLLAQDNLASLGTLMAGIVHEIRNSLNFVINFGDIIGGLAVELEAAVASAREDLGGDVAAEVFELIGDIIPLAGKVADHGRQATQIVESVLKQARTGDPAFLAADLNALTQEYVDLAYHGVTDQRRGPRAHLQTEFDQNLQPVTVDPQGLGRVILNIVGNALDATREAVSNKEGDYTPAISVTTRDLGDSVQVMVRDNGMGIPDALLGQVFQPFFTTKRLGEGSGIGLSLCRDIVERQHHGSLTIYSKPGEGAEVVVTVPKDLTVHR